MTEPARRVYGNSDIRRVIFALPARPAPPRRCWQQPCTQFPRSLAGIPAENGRSGHGAN